MLQHTNYRVARRSDGAGPLTKNLVAAIGATSALKPVVRIASTPLSPHRGAVVPQQRRRCDVAAAPASSVPAAVQAVGKAATAAGQTGYRDLINAILTPLGGPESPLSFWFISVTRDVVLPVILVLGLYNILTSLAVKAKEFVEAEVEVDEEGNPVGQQQELGTMLRLTSLALTGPSASVLPWVLGINVVRNLAWICNTWINKFNPILPNDWLDDVVRLMCASLVPIDSILTKVSIIGCSVFVCWVFLKWMDVMIQYLVQRQATQDKAVGGGHGKAAELQTMLAPVSNLLSWVMVGVTTIVTLSSLGVDLRPLLAVGGASGIIIGLATQQLLGNAVSGLNIFLARPFLPGEHITLVGTTPITGMVMRIDPLRTLIATDDFSTVAVPNKLIADMVVINRSRASKVSSASSLAVFVRDLRFRMKLPHAALDRIEELCAELEGAVAELAGQSGSAAAAARRAMGVTSVNGVLSVQITKFVDSGVELTARMSLPNTHSIGLEQRMPFESKMQRTFMALSKVVRAYGGMLISA